MKQRLNFMQVAPSAFKAMYGIKEYLENTSLDKELLELVRVRASQINGCPFCIDMHVKEARAVGENEQRLHLLNAWRESPSYTDRERAALEWTEAITLIRDSRAPDTAYEQARQHFSEEELANLTLAIASINSWNRLMIGFRTAPGTAETANG